MRSFHPRQTCGSIDTGSPCLFSEFLLLSAMSQEHVFGFLACNVLLCAWCAGYSLDRNNLYLHNFVEAGLRFGDARDVVEALSNVLPVRGAACGSGLLAFAALFPCCWICACSRQCAGV